MAWTSRFLGYLAGDAVGPFEYVVRSVAIGVTDRVHSVGSHDAVVDGYATHAGLIAGSVRTQGSSISMRGWQATAGGFSFGVTATAYAQILGAWTGGTVVELLLRPARTSSGGAWPFERIGLGVIDRMRQVPGSAEITCRDLSAGLQARFTAVADDALLFANLPGETVTTVSSVASTTVTLADASLFEFDSASAGVFKTAAGVYYKFTGKAGNDLTGCTLLDGSPGTPLATTAVQPCAYLTGHPVRAALRVLVSTGLGTNGPEDTLPETWGYALPEALVDGKYSRTAAGSLGGVAAGLGSNWHVVVDEPVTNGWSWLNSWLNPAGLFVDQRQGQVVIGAIQTPHLASRVHTLALDDLATTGIEVEALDPQAVGEYGSVKLDFDGTGGSTIFGTPGTDDLATLPCLGVAATLSFEGFTNGLATLVDSAGRTAIEGDVENRVARYYTRRGERLSLTLGGLAAAQLHRGEIVRVSSTKVRSRMPAGLGAPGLPCMVTRIAPTWSGCTVRASLVALPPSEARTFRRLLKG